MNGHGMNEDEIRDVLGKGIGEEPPIVGGPAAVFAAARARVVRTRVVTGALSAVAVLGVAAGAVAFGTGVGGGGQSAAGSSAQCAVGPVPPKSGSPTGKVSPSPGVTAASPGNSGSGQPTSTATSSPGPGRVLIDPQSQVLRLKQVLPCGTASEFSGSIDYHAAPGDGIDVFGHLYVADRLGVGTVGAELFQAGAWGRDQMKCYPDDIACEAEVLKDGTLVKSYEYLVGSPNPSGKLIAWTTEMQYPDGRHVVVSSSNYAPRGKNGDNPTRKIPPLTRAQVRGIALDVEWTTTVTKDFAARAKREITPFVDTRNDATAVSDQSTKG
jgi:hypothetical protein